MRFERESKALTRALAPYRSGPQGQLRAQVRCMLVRLMGFADCDDIPIGIREIPHRFPQRSELEPDEIRDMMAVAHDALLELGYDAAAYELTNRGRDPHFEKSIEFGWEGSQFPHRAKRALEFLEGGPPSISFDGYPLIPRTLRRFRSPRGEYVVGRNPADPAWWYRLIVGKAVHNKRGEWTGWDREAGYTFQRRGRTLDDVLSGQYGSEDLRGMEVPPPEPLSAAVFPEPSPKASAKARAAFWRRHGKRT